MSLYKFQMSHICFPHTSFFLLIELDVIFTMADCFVLWIIALYACLHNTMPWHCAETAVCTLVVVVADYSTCSTFRCSGAGIAGTCEEREAPALFL